MHERPQVKPNKTWICERKSRAVTTIFVDAPTRKEAQVILDAGGGDCMDVSHYDIGRARVIKEDNVDRRKS